jgi:hypothetical protein
VYNTLQAFTSCLTMLFKTLSASVYGIDAYVVEVEVDVGSARMQDFNVAGLPDNAVKESRERIKSALRNCSFEFSHGQGVTINLAPADVVKSGGVRLPSAKAKTYQMYLTIDGQKRFRSTETPDYDEAIDKLREWEAQARIGHRETTGLRYEEIRADYLASGKSIGHASKTGPSAIQRDLDTFFKNIRVSAIGGRLNEFRKWRESQSRCSNQKPRTLKKRSHFAR